MISSLDFCSRYCTSSFYCLTSRLTLTWTHSACLSTVDVRNRVNPFNPGDIYRWNHLPHPYLLDLNPDDRCQGEWMLEHRQSQTGIFSASCEDNCHVIRFYSTTYLTSSLSSYWALCFTGVTLQPWDTGFDLLFSIVFPLALVSLLQVAQWIL